MGFSFGGRGVVGAFGGGLPQGVRAAGGGLGAS